MRKSQVHNFKTRVIWYSSYGYKYIDVVVLYENFAYLSVLKIVIYITRTKEIKDEENLSVREVKSINIFKKRQL